ncbi:hypothetical protein EV183_004398 [Coemansia sp. RSA 2336]|nr:hypothetical protein EV183_004398 [Coemansia sp. RSA 2336]
MLKTFIAMAVLVMVGTMALPVDKRDGPVLALPGPGESLGNFLGRLFGPLPLLGALPAGLGLPPPKPN